MNEDLEAKVVRLYITKGYSLNSFSNLKICGAKKASEILHKYNLMRDKTEFKYKVR